MTNQNNEKSKNGKRLALILIAILLLVAIAFGAYTYSRYVTRDEGTGSATVAQWGYEVTVANTDDAESDNPFSTEYSVNDNVVISSISNSGIVAPGASGSVTITVKGQSEVNAAISLAIDASATDVYLTVNADSTNYRYYPIKYTLHEDTAEGDAVEYGSDTISGYTLPQLKATLDTYAASQNPLGVYEAGYSVDKTYVLTWEWAFTGTENEILYNENGTVATGVYVNAADVDKLDTVLGELVYNGRNSSDMVDYSYSTVSGSEPSFAIVYESHSIHVSFNLGVTIAQVQSAATITNP